MKRLIFFLVFQSSLVSLFAQPDRWQQRAKYTMKIDMDVVTNKFSGTQKLEYTNNSPDTLKKVFYHLYFNAFQPNSMLDVRSRRQGTIQIGRNPDWDDRVKDRIANLKPDEIGFQKILSLKMNGRAQQFEVLETILLVKLDKPILPRSKVVFDMDFEAQVPLQVRRSGRDNSTNKVRYSMSQWYPKMCEYDYEGWHPTPYVGREFYGVWGDFDVSISIDKNYVLGGTGYVQNANQVGFGYESPGANPIPLSGDKRTWRFVAPNVHDFVWAADPGYKHYSKKIREGLILHVLYKAADGKDAKWMEIMANAEKAWPFIEKTFGVYPYNQFSFIEGGDGAMEYPMATLLSNSDSWLHELMHAWYYGALATNESLHPWMDEGFTDYATVRVRAYLNNQKDWPFEKNYASYLDLVRSGKEESLTTHSDHYNTNYAFVKAAYTKGAVFMEQLGYIVGAKTRDKILLEYFRQWKFKHPNPNDFLRIAEKLSDMKLDWYKEYFINSVRTIDYAFDNFWEEGGKTMIRLKRVGAMPMPIDLKLTFKDSSSEIHYIPLDLMYGEKPAEDSTPRKSYSPWKWTHETYVIETDRRLGDIVMAEIDPSHRLADVERQNNRLKLEPKAF
jgi:hypothetical protein